MSDRIRFQANQRKILESVLLVAEEVPNIDIYHLLKVIYYAEKEHLNRYARPITGDYMRALEWGPVPMITYNLANQADGALIDPEVIESFKKKVKVAHRGAYKTLKASKRADRDQFSQTELDCLLQAARDYGRMPFNDLKRIGHEESCYHNTAPGMTITYEDMIEGPNREEVISILLEEGPYVVL